MDKNKPLKNKILIIGCGRFGSSIANKFSEQGKNVMVIDLKKENFDRLVDNFMGYTFAGDATDLTVLEKAGIATASDVIVTTGKDNFNIFVAHVARKIYEVPNIYVRLEDPDNEQLLKGYKVNAIYPFELCVDEFNHLRGGNK